MNLQEIKNKYLRLINGVPIIGGSELKEVYNLIYNQAIEDAGKAARTKNVNVSIQGGEYSDKRVDTESILKLKK